MNRVVFIEAVPPVPSTRFRKRSLTYHVVGGEVSGAAIEGVTWYGVADRNRTRTNEKGRIFIQTPYHFHVAAALYVNWIFAPGSRVNS